MQMKLKSGKTIELTDEELKEVLEKSGTEYFDAEKLEEYFEHMHKKAHANIEMISESDVESEKDLKKALEKVMHYGSYSDVADMIVEVIECKISKMLLESMD